MSQTITQILNEIISKIGNTSQQDFTSSEPYHDYCDTAKMYIKQYSIIPEEWRDPESNELLALTFHSTKETMKIWGKSLTIRYNCTDDEYDPEYDQGDVDDYWNERLYECR